ncbi:MAG: hypothetical protein JSU72_06805 [Deltaproteobacteria bacterium]|nr:MAG: hypothetical protein JSU72_06805 [Deltaproteobacteria bacterium]
MRCPKCGYFSFDYLQQCKKCSRELTDVHEELNLLDFNPKVPFLLGTLVGQMHGIDAGSPHPMSLAQETELELAGLDTGEPSGIEGTVDMSGITQTMDGEPVEEMELSEIAFEGLETTDKGVDGGVVDLEDFTGDGGEAAGHAEEDEGFMGLEIDMNQGLSQDSGTVEETLSMDDMSELDLGSVDDESFDLSEMGETRAEDAEQTMVSSEPALELDLSEDDLSALAKELEGQLEADAGQKKKAAADQPIAELDEIVLELEED